MNYALIIVDVQFDFLPGGTLGVPDGDQVLLPIRNYAATPDCKLVVASRDWHPENHFSFSEHPMYVDGSWPAHCVQSTRGAKIHSSVRKVADYTISKGMNRNPPDAYSAFAGKTLRPVQTLEEILQRLNQGYPIEMRDPCDTVVVSGLALDYCVKHTALDANALGFRTIVPLDATRGVDPDTSTEAVAVMEKAGIEVVEHFHG